MRAHARTWVSGILVAALLAIPAPAKAGPILMTLDPIHIINQGDMATYDGSITNTAPPDVYLNSDSLTISGFPDITSDDTPFLVNVPAFLSFPGSTGVVGFFDVFVSLTAPPGLYSGSFTVLGGADGTELNSLATKDFQVLVQAAQAVPEPATMTLFGIGLAAAAARRRTRGSTRARTIERRDQAFLG